MTDAVGKVDELEALGRHYKLKKFPAEPTDYFDLSKICLQPKPAISQIFNKL